MALQRTAKSCRSDAPMLASSLREEAQATVSNKPGHRGEHEVSRKTIARGMPGDFRCDRGDYTRVLHLNFAREAAGAAGTRHSLRPLIPGRTIDAQLGRLTSRDRGVAFENCRDAIARSDLSTVARRATASAEARRAKAEGGSDKAIHSPSS